MYQYVAGISLTRGLRPVLVSDDISTLSLKTVLQTYERNTIIVSNPVLTHNVAFVLQTYYNELVNYTGTLVEWLASLGTRALATTDTLPNLTLNSAKYHNLNALWFTQKPTNITGNLANDVRYAEANDLILIKTGVDYPTLFQNALFTVNGYLHRASLSPDGIYLLDAAKHARLANETNTGVLSLLNVSTLTCYPITPSQLQPPDPYIPYKDKILLVPPFSTKGKQVGLVIGGVLYWQDDVVTVCGDTLVQLSTHLIDWVDRYFYDRDYLDLSSLPLPNQSGLASKVLASADYQADGFYQAWLALSTSFWVVFDNPYLEVQTIPLEGLKWPGEFLVANDDPIPVVLSGGFFAEAAIRPGQDRSTLVTSHYTKRTGLYKTTHYQADPLVSDYALQSDPWVNQQAYWLKISSY